MAELAPDVAAMVKRLRDACIDYDGSQEVDAAQAVHHPTCGMLREAAALIEKLGQGWIPVSPVAGYQEHHFKAEDVGVAWNGNRIWVCLDGAALLRAKLFDGKFQVLFSPPPPERP